MFSSVGALLWSSWNPCWSILLLEWGMDLDSMFLISQETAHRVRRMIALVGGESESIPGPQTHTPSGKHVLCACKMDPLYFLLYFLSIRTVFYISQLCQFLRQNSAPNILTMKPSFPFHPRPASFQALLQGDMVHHSRASCFTQF